MSDMVEKIARVLFERGRLEGVDPASWEAAPEGMRDWLRGHARAAIEAMREPTEDIIGEGFRPAYVRSVEAPAVVYRAMIDAALSNSPERNTHG